MLFSGWRAVLALVLALAVLVLLIAVALWIAVALTVVGAILWLNLVFLPRFARGLHVPVLALELTCLPLLGGIGWLLGGPTGAVFGALAWLAGIGAPRLVGRRLRARLRSATSPPGTIIVVPSRD
jgi:hypothetical protein